MAALVATVLLLVAVLDVAWAYAELALLPCDPHDQRQLWTMPHACVVKTRGGHTLTGCGLARGGTLIHQSTKLCLMPQDCDIDVETPLVLDDCNSSCVQNNPAADVFVLHHNQGVAPRALEVQGTWVGDDYPPPSYHSANTTRLFVTATSRTPAVALMPWDAMSPAHQQWMTATPFLGPDHILQVGKAKDEQPLCDAMGIENDGCCLGVLDDGWGPILARISPVVGVVLLATVVAGVVSKRLRKRKADAALGDNDGGDRGLQEPRTTPLAPDSVGALFDPLIATERHGVGTKTPHQDSSAEEKLLRPDAWVPVLDPPQLDSSGDISSIFEATDGQLNAIWRGLECSVEANSTSDNTAESSDSIVGAGAIVSDAVALSANRAALLDGEDSTLKQGKSDDLACVKTKELEDGCIAEEALQFAADFPGWHDGVSPVCDMGTASSQAAPSSFGAVMAPVAPKLGPSGAPVKPEWGPSGAVAGVAPQFYCPFPGCGHTAEREGHLKDHIKTHTGEKPFACPYPGCTYRSTARGHINRHYRSHTKEKPYRCTYPGCDFASSQSNHVTTHMCKHTGERPFRCDFEGCDYAAARAWLVTRHKATRHQESGEASTTRASTSVKTHPANDSGHAQAASDESVEACGITLEADTHSPPAQTQPSRMPARQIVQVAQAVGAAELSRSASAAAATTAAYATVVTGDQESQLCEQWQVELSPGLWCDFPIATMRMFSSTRATGATCLSLSARGRDYTIDLILMVQRNSATGTTRKIRTLEAPHLV